MQNRKTVLDTVTRLYASLPPDAKPTVCPVVFVCNDIVRRAETIPSSSDQHPPPPTW